MKQMFRIPGIRAAAVVVAAAAVMVAVVGCTSLKEEFIPDEPVVVPGEGKSVTLKGTISMGGGSPVSKALTEEGVKTFAVGDSITVVYKNTGGQTVKAVSKAFTAEDIHEEGKKADIRVTLVDPLAGGALRYIYPAAMAKEEIATGVAVDNDEATIAFERLANQDGTLASIASGLDLAVFDGILTEGAELPVSASLSNKLTICRFTVKEGSSDITSKLSNFTVSNGEHTYTLSPAAPAAKFAGAPIYVAMRPVVSGEIAFTATDNVNGYEKSVSGKTLAAGSIYPIGITLSKSFDGKATPLTFEAMEAGAEVSLKLPSNAVEGEVQYRVNDGAWTNYTVSELAIALANVGDKVQFRGNRSTYFVGNYDHGQFSCSVDCYVYGNVMSMVTDFSSDENAFASNVALTAEKTFFRLFENNNTNNKNTLNIKNHPTKPLVLPATTLTANCYEDMFYKTGLTKAPELPAMTLANECYVSMFSNCKLLTSAPVLPAETLAASCYRRMFDGCKSLTIAPKLPAETLAAICYSEMFASCTSLTSAPELPATDLAFGCYLEMFSGCTNLTTAPDLPAKTLAGSCYRYMFSRCSSLTSAPELPATVLADNCYCSMFEYCTSLTTAPVLPAETLVSHCYDMMFYECSNLNSVTCLATDYETSNLQDCTNDWLNGVAHTGTFTCPSWINWVPGDSGCPSGWTQKFKGLSLVTPSDVGRVAGADGKIYYNAYAAEYNGTTAVAMIAYVGAVAGVCEHGLAISLTDIKGYNMTYSQAVGEYGIPDWAAAHPLTGATWRLPSFKDWQYMLWGYYVDAPEVTNISSFNNKLSDAIWNTSLPSASLPVNAYFWTSSVVDEDNAKALYQDSLQEAGFQTTLKTQEWHVRACLAF